MARDFSSDQWGVILGGSSGFGLATAHKLAQHGMNLCLVHRDRRAVLARIEPEFEKIRGSGVKLLTFNVDALAAAKRAEVSTSWRRPWARTAACACSCTRSPSAT